MTDLQEKAMRMALERLESHEYWMDEDAIQALRQALAQPAQEPVAHLWECIGRWTAMVAHDGKEANLAPPDWLIDAVKAATAPVDAVNMSQECVDETAKHEQEPAMWVTPDGNGFRLRLNPPINDVPLGWEPFYTAPPKREWVGLTDDDLVMCESEEDVKFVRTIEAKLKEKNT